MRHIDGVGAGHHIQLQVPRSKAHQQRPNIFFFRGGGGDCHTTDCPTRRDFFHIPENVPGRDENCGFVPFLKSLVLGG